jgi:hypothetical protein
MTHETYKINNGCGSFPIEVAAVGVRTVTWHEHGVEPAITGEPPEERALAPQ